MNSDEDVLLGALQLEALGQRAAYLERACTLDREQQARVASLLDGYDLAERLLLTRPLVVPPPPPGLVPQRIGRYRLIRPLGEGGVGSVFLAEQEEPVRRMVALKVIKPGMDSREVIARFESERQALALMNHPNIAHVFDAGATAEGHPFFVMEFIDGQPMTRFCDEHRMNIEARLALFVDVCHALAHAHNRGIIHRDIKPSNILVSMDAGVPTPRVIDFGIAKATQGSLIVGGTVVTAIEQFIGTPVYMSPEQAEMSGRDIDTRSDIYSLGVLLYELITGRPPFDPNALAAAPIDEVRRLIRESEPPRPSRRFARLDRTERAAIAAARGVAAAQLSARLEGDLDWIVMRCLEKDRARRYDATNELAIDIQRTLRSEPVGARPPSTGYMLGKLVRRHRVGFAAAGVIVASLMTGLGVSIWSLIKERAARERAVAAEREQFRLREEAQRAQANEAELRRSAEAQELAARLKAYAADINLLQQSLFTGMGGRARELLDGQRPRPGQRDLRGWEWRYLWQLCRGDPHREIWRQPHAIKSLSASADGEWVAIAGYPGGGVSVRNLRTDQETRLPSGDRLTVAAFSPREPVLAFAGSESAGGGFARSHFVALWNVPTQTLVERVALPAQCLSLNFSNDGRMLVTSTGSPDHAITVWRTPGLKPLAKWPAAQPGYEAKYSFTVSANLEFAAYHTGARAIRVIDLRTGAERWTVPVERDFAGALAFSPDGRILASGVAYGESPIWLWDSASGKGIGRLDGHVGFVTDLVFWPDGRTLASASGDQTIRLWDVPSRRLLRTLTGHRAEVWRIALLPDNTLLSGGKDGTVCRWDPSAWPAPSPAVNLPAKIVAYQFAPDSKSILALESDGTVGVWRGSGFAERVGGMNIGEVAPDVYIAKFSPTGRLLAAKRRGGGVEVWDLAERRLWRGIGKASGGGMPIAFLRGDERLIVFTPNPSRFHEWDLVADREVGSWLAPEAGHLSCFTLSPDETTALMIGPGGKSIVRDMKTGLSVACELSVDEVIWPRYSPDGHFFAAPSNAGVAKLWRAGTRDEAAVFSGYGTGVQSVAFSPDGRRLAAGGGGVAIRIWDLESRQPLLTLDALDAKGSLFRPTAFSPDGNILASLSQGSLTLHLWRAPSMEEIEAAETSAVRRGQGSSRESPD